MYRMLIALAVSAAIFGSGFRVSTWRSDAVINDMRAEAAQNQMLAVQRALDIENLQDQLSAAADTNFALANREVEVVYKQIEKEVIRYVQTDNAVDCGIDNVGVRVHDIAATGRVPTISEASSSPDAATSGVTNAELIHTVASNYKSCRQTGQQLERLIQWVAATNAQAQSAKGRPSK